MDAAAIEGEDLRARVAEQDGRVGGDDELGVLVVAQGVVDEDQEGELALRGEGSFGFVEEEEAGAAELVVEDGEEGFSVGALVEGDASVARVEVELVDTGGEVEEGLGAEEKAFSGAIGVKAEFERAGERIGVGGGELGVEGEVAVAAFEREAVAEGERLKQGGLADAVLASEEGNARGGSGRGG